MQYYPMREYSATPFVTTRCEIGKPHLSLGLAWPSRIGWPLTRAVSHRSTPHGDTRMMRDTGISGVSPRQPQPGLRWAR
jgi:hypothetical protein